jgi:hypothetical protein
LNAEAEKVQYLLGTLETTVPLPTTGLTFDQVMALNGSVNKTILGLAHKELVLLNKLEETIELLEELDDGGAPGDCLCQAFIQNATGLGITVNVDGTPVIGNIAVNGIICPGCSSADSTVTYTFTETPVVPPNQSFTFTATEINPPTCVEGPNGREFFTSGTGIVTVTETGQTFTASFSTFGNDNLSGIDVIGLSIFNTPPGSLFTSLGVSFSLPGGSLVITECE